MCSGLHMSNGEYKTVITWECFANGTKACVTRTEDCSKCDGTFKLSSATHTFPEEEGDAEAEKPKEGEEPKEEEAKEEEKEKEEKDKDEKPETKGGRLSNYRRGGKRSRRSKPKTGRSEISKDPISCATVCTKKNGKHVKGKVEYSTFKVCEGAEEEEGEKPKEYKEKDEKDGEEEKGEDKEEDKEKEKEKEEKAEKERRFRRMRRF